MKSSMVLLFGIFLFCFGKHKTAREIYESGKIENIGEFRKIDNDDDTLEDIYQYIYDANFVVKKEYGDSRNIFRGYAMFYEKKKVGKWIIYDFSGVLFTEINFKNDKYDGLRLIYNDDGSLKNKELYKDGLLIYEVKYSDKGEKIDSVASQ